MSFLEEIMRYKRQEIAQRKERYPLTLLQAEAEGKAPAPNFIQALHQAPSTPALIAEIKKASPSKGVLRADLDPLALAHLYSQNGAVAVSILTDEKYFQGHLDVLRQVRDALPSLPCLQKDFICDPYQVYEARAAGASAVLLIVAALDQPTLLSLHTLVRSLGMTPLVEVHNLDELHRALECEPVLIGINNRNLHDFSVDLETTFQLIPHIPDGIGTVAESGLHSAADVQRLAIAGVDAILVGEALVTADDVTIKVREMAGLQNKRYL